MISTRSDTAPSAIAKTLFQCPCGTGFPAGPAVSSWGLRATAVSDDKPFKGVALGWPQQVPLSASIMAITILCPNLRCRTVLSVPDGVRGKKVRCSQCGIAFLVPAAPPKKGENDPKPNQPRV